MSEIRWLGPYAPEDRHADDETIGHIIALRKQSEIAERQMNNALDAALAAMHKERVFRYALHQIAATCGDERIVAISRTAFEEANDL